MPADTVNNNHVLLYAVFVGSKLVVAISLFYYLDLRLIEVFKTLAYSSCLL